MTADPTNEPKNDSAADTKTDPPADPADPDPAAAKADDRLPDDHPVVKALAKANEEAKAARLKVKEFEDAQKTEQERLAEQLETERAGRRQADVEAAKYRAAIAHGLSQEDLDWLGDDPDQIEDRAARLAERLAAATPEPSPTPQRRPGERLKTGAAPEPTSDKSVEDIAAAIMRRR